MNPAGSKRWQDGFSLIEMCLVLVVTGILMATLSTVYLQHTSGRKITVTRNALNTVQAAMTEYKGRMGAYPCPARAGAGRGDVDYGVSNCSLAPVFGRDTDDPGTDPDPILVGDIPFKTMESVIRDVDMKARDTIDGWGNKLSYAVTLSLTDNPPAVFNDRYGAISIEDENAKSVLPEPGTAHLILISHGDNGRGAYTPDGQLVQNCVIGTPVIPPPPAPPPPVPLAHNDTENCDSDGTFLSGLRYMDEFSYNDDLVKYLIVQNTSLWAYTGSTFDAAGNFILQVANSNPGRVGIGTDTPQEPLHIAGDVQAEQLQVNEFCDSTGLICMNPESIGGNAAAMQCPSGFAMTQIANDTAICTQVFTAIPGGATCPAGEVMVGVSSVTGIICEPAP